MNSPPLITVIALCYNHAQYLTECLEGIRKQTHQPLELIIMDDCSADHSVEVIREWISKHQVICHFIPHKKNAGICKSLNEALSFAHGEFVSITSTDDVWLEDKLEQQIKVFQSRGPNTGVVYSDAIQIDSKGQVLESLFIESHRKLPVMPQGKIFSVLLEGNFIPAPSVLIRRSCYDTVGTYNEELCYEDYDMWLKISQHYEFAFCPVIGTKYRFLDHSLSRKMSKQLSFQRHDSNFKISKKFLELNGLEKSNQKKLKAMLSHNVFYLAGFNCPNIMDHLKYAMRVDPRIITLLLLFLNFIKTPTNTQKTIIECLRSIKRSFKNRV